MNAGAIIEPACAEHFEEIAALATIIWTSHYPAIISLEQIDYMLRRMYDPAVMRRELESGIAYDRLIVGRALRGFTSYGPTDNRRELKLHKLYIHPKFQRQGWGALLLQRVEHVARVREFNFLVLAVNKKNAAAIAAYRKNGFMIRESVVTDIGSGFVMDDYVMVKPLL